MEEETMDEDAPQEQSDFIEVKRRRKRTRAKPTSGNDSGESDSDCSILSSKTSNINRSKKSNLEVIQTSKATSSKTDTQTPPTSKKAPIPPINVILDDVNHTYPTLAKLLKATCSMPPSVNSLSSGAVSVRSSVLEDFRKIISVLEVHNFQYYLYRSAEAPPMKVVIKHLHKSIPSILVQEDLVEQGLPVLSVSQLRAHKDKRPLPMFLVTLDPTEKAAEIMDLKSVLFHRIKVEPYKKPNSPLQCHNCQRFHHVSNLCHADARCVKCGLSHKTASCIKTSDLPAKCANCGESHTASYRGCREFKRAAKKPLKPTPKADVPKYVAAPIPTSNPWAVLASNETEQPAPPPETTPTTFPTLKPSAASRKVQPSTPKPAPKPSPAQGAIPKAKKPEPAPAVVPTPSTSRPQAAAPKQRPSIPPTEPTFESEVSNILVKATTLAMEILGGTVSRAEMIKRVTSFLQDILNLSPVHE